MTTFIIRRRLQDEREAENLAFSTSKGYAKVIKDNYINANKIFVDSKGRTFSGYNNHFQLSYDQYIGARYFIIEYTVES